MKYALGFDIGATKVAWGIVSETGTIKEEGLFPTPSSLEELLRKVEEVWQKHRVRNIGIGVPGIVSANHQETLLCTNFHSLSDQPLVELIKKKRSINIVLENDGRCALIGEVWQGAARSLKNVVMLTLGTGVGGSVMQNGKVLAHPYDVTQELGRIVVDPTDVFPASTGPGTIEAFIGGHSLEKRLHIDLYTIAYEVRNNNKSAEAAWKDISSYFIQCMKILYDRYQPEVIIIGGIGSNDLPYYLQDSPPCPVISASLGNKAGMIGAARLALDSVNT